MLGPVLAMCGLVGGAGTTTLSYLIALGAARQTNEPVLVADSGGPSGALAALAGVEAPRSLPELAAQLATGESLRDGVFARGRADLRVLASGPEFTDGCPEAALHRVLRDAREAHALTVIDCGTLARRVDRTTAAAATHLAWVVPVTQTAVTCGERVLSAAPNVAAKPVLVGRSELRQQKARLGDLRRLAAERNAPLILVPHLASLEAGDIDRAAEDGQVAIQAILGALRR
jgi:MinD-like ATPase involved in chromosome partitioning or flagellar assembly